MAASVLLAFGVAYALWSGNTVPVGVFAIGLVDWTVLTLFTRYVKTKAGWKAANMGGLSNAIAFATGIFAAKALPQNPDGDMYIVFNAIIGYAGGLLGTLIAVDIFPDKPEQG